jgi:hypothetical protein
VHPFHEPARVLRSAIVLKPSTLLHLHHVLAKRKYRILFSPKRRRQPGPKGPNKELIDAVVELKRRSPKWGGPRIAQITLAFGVEIDKDVIILHFFDLQNCSRGWGFSKQAFTPSAGNKIQRKHGLRTEFLDGGKKLSSEIAFG